MELKGSTITVALPDDLEWIDEYEWISAKEDVSITLNGSMVIQSAKQAKGRLITLQGGSDFAWIDKNTIEALRQLAEDAENMTLTFKDGSSHTVRFRYKDGAFSAKPLVPNIDTFSDVVIRLMEV